MVGPNSSSASLATSFAGESTDDSAAPCEPPDSERRQNTGHRRQMSVARSDASAMASPAVSEGMKLPLPVQKRQRVTRACDECRRKKIKCDGKQPCTHCTVYSYLCTYDQPSNRRRNLPSQYVETLEHRLEKAEAILKVILPDLNLDDPTLDASTLQKRLSDLKSERGGSPASETHDNTDVINDEPKPKAPNPTESNDEGLLESMLDQSGSLDLDDEGHWDYHGQSSGIIFIQQLRKFGNILPDKPFPVPRPVPESSSKAPSESPSGDMNISPISDLPPRHVTFKLCENALEDACAAMRFMHKPTFYAMVDRIYDIPPEQYTNEEHSMLPLLYLTVACGCLFGTSEIEKMGYKSATDRAYQYYKIGRQMLDITECRDLVSLQAILFMIIFLQSSASISTCYSYVGIALRSALRLGLHRSVTANFNPIEQEIRKRIFWVVRKMDVHISTIMGLPSMLSDEDIDQEYPLPIDDEFITKTEILPVPEGYVNQMAGIIAHIQLGKIVTKVTKYIYPVKTASIGHNHTYLIRHSKIREIEGDLDEWLNNLPDVFKPGMEAPPHIERIRQLLRIGYAHVQMIMYRPFLHYVTGARQNPGVDKRSYACAAACVTVARNVVHIAACMKKRGFLNGSYWFTMYTTYFAILALLFFILENPDSTTARDGILRDALEGKNTLAGLAKNSMAADRCAQSLNSIFKHLPEKLRNRQPASQVNRKRPSVEPTATAATSATASKAELPTSASDSNLSGKWGQTSQRTPNFSTTKINSGKKLPSHNRRSSRMNNGNGPGPTLAHHGPSHLSNSMTISQLPPTNGDMNTSNSAQSTESSAASTPQMQQQEIPQVGMDQSQGQGQPSGSQPLQQQQQQQQPQQFTYGGTLDKMNYIPDLMPMMFPTDDPFAYPTQPMSTLEDSTFRNFGNLIEQHQPNGMDNGYAMGNNTFLQNVFDLKHTNSMPNLTTMVNGDAAATASNPDLTPYSGDGDITLQTAPPLGSLADDFAPTTFGMPNFTYFNNNLQPHFPDNDVNMQGMPPAVPATTAESVMGDGLITSPGEMQYNMNDPFLWTRGDDGNAVNNSNHNRVPMPGNGGGDNNPDNNNRLGTNAPMRLKPNSRTSSDATQQLMARLHLKPQSRRGSMHAQNSSAPPAPPPPQQQQQQQQQQQWDASQCTFQPSQPQMSQRLPLRGRRQKSPGPTMNPAAVSNSSIAQPQTPAPTPISAAMSINGDHSQHSHSTDDLQDYGMGMGIGLASAPYGDFSTMGLEVGLGLPLMVTGHEGGSPRTTADNSPAMGSSDASNGNGHHAAGAGAGANGPESGAVEWNQWMNVNGI